MVHTGLSVNHSGGSFTLTVTVTTTAAFAASVDQDQTAQNVQSDL